MFKWVIIVIKISITSKHLDFGIKKILNQILKIAKDFNGFRLVFYGIYLDKVSENICKT